MSDWLTIRGYPVEFRYQPVRDADDGLFPIPAGMGWKVKIREDEYGYSINFLGEPTPKDLQQARELLETQARESIDAILSKS